MSRPHADRAQARRGRIVERCPRKRQHAGFSDVPPEIDTREMGKRKRKPWNRQRRARMKRDPSCNSGKRPEASDSRECSAHRLRQGGFLPHQAWRRRRRKVHQQATRGGVDLPHPERAGKEA